MSVASFALVLGATGTFVGSLGGITGLIKWLIRRSDDRKNQARTEAAQSSTIEAKRLSDAIDWAGRLKTQLDQAEQENDELRAQRRQDAIDLDAGIGRERAMRLELDELRTKCNRLERQAKKPK